MNKQGKGSKKTIVALVLCLCMLWSTAIMAYAEGGTYTVKKDDNLSKIAQEVYGDRKEWRTIYEANKGTVKDPNIIYAGQQLILPGAPVAEVENVETAVAQAPDANGAAAAVPEVNDATTAGKTPEEMNDIGNMYFYGDGAEQDFTKAMEWYQKAAALGNVDAMNNIAWMYLDGTLSGKQDFAKAQEWYAKAEAAAAAE